jgi:hypothetical protein
LTNEESLIVTEDGIVRKWERIKKWMKI